MDKKQRKRKIQRNMENRNNCSYSGFIHNPYGLMFFLKSLLYFLLKGFSSDLVLHSTKVGGRLN